MNRVGHPIRHFASRDKSVSFGRIVEELLRRGSLLADDVGIDDPCAIVRRALQDALRSHILIRYVTKLHTHSNVCNYAEVRAMGRDVSLRPQCAVISVQICATSARVKFTEDG